MTISRAPIPPVTWPSRPTVSLCSPTETGPSTLPSTSRSSLPEMAPLTLMLGLSQEPARAVAPVWPPLLDETLAALGLSPARPEDALGAFDCDSLFRHTVILHPS